MLTFKPISQSPPPSSCQATIVDYFSQLSKLLHHLLVIIKPRPNPNCPSYLLPAVPSRGKQKTGICRRTTSPRWEQTIVWEDLSMEEVKNNCSLYHWRIPDVWQSWKYEDDNDLSRWWRGVWSWRSGTTTGSARPRISSVEPGLYFSQLILWICQSHFHGFVKVNFSTRSGSTLVPAATSVARLPGWTGLGRKSRCGSRCWTGPTSGWRAASDSGQAWTLGLNSDLDPNLCQPVWPLTPPLLFLLTSLLHSVTRASAASGCITCDTDLELDVSHYLWYVSNRDHYVYITASQNKFCICHYISYYQKLSTDKHIVEEHSA